ncbi:EF-hand_domain [Hexamita inflata]|uniref:EF-hand domain n=1 Tax=Hexamita inflata TaxID=28002 RepID=A0AA86VCT0_9EUKA|nr:EF-hand domain [Hexamita inflata]
MGNMFKDYAYEQYSLIAAREEGLKILRTDQNFYKSKNRPQIGHLRTDLRCERKTIQVYFQKFDRDCNGKLDVDEWCKMLEQVFK